MSIEFRIKYDKVADAIYICLGDGKIVESDEIAPGVIVDFGENNEILGIDVIVDFGENNEILGIEILQASKRRLDLMKLIVEGPEALVNMV